MVAPVCSKLCGQPEPQGRVAVLQEGWQRWLGAGPEQVRALREKRQPARGQAAELLLGSGRPLPGRALRSHL